MVDNNKIVLYGRNKSAATSAICGMCSIIGNRTILLSCAGITKS